MPDSTHSTVEEPERVREDVLVRIEQATGQNRRWALSIVDGLRYPNGDEIRCCFDSLRERIGEMNVPGVPALQGAVDLISYIRDYQALTGDSEGQRQAHSLFVAVHPDLVETWPMRLGSPPERGNSMQQAARAFARLGVTAQEAASAFRSAGQVFGIISDSIVQSFRQELNRVSVEMVQLRNTPPVNPGQTLQLNGMEVLVESVEITHSHDDFTRVTISGFTTEFGGNEPTGNIEVPEEDITITIPTSNRNKKRRRSIEL